MTRAVVDANVVISGVLVPRGTSAAILDAWRAGLFELVICPELIAEVDEKLHLPRIRRKYALNEAEIQALLTGLAESATVVPGTAPVDPTPPDEDDTMIFAAAVESNADFIVTGDKLLLGFAWPGPGRIVSPRQFYDLHPWTPE